MIDVTTPSDNWWAHRPAEAKCRIASEIYHDTIASPKEATRIWMLLDDDRRNQIMSNYGK